MEARNKPEAQAREKHSFARRTFPSLALQACVSGLCGGLPPLELLPLAGVSPAEWRQGPFARFQRGGGRAVAAGPQVSQRILSPVRGQRQEKGNNQRENGGFHRRGVWVCGRKCQQWAIGVPREKLLS